MVHSTNIYYEVEINVGILMLFFNLIFSSSKESDMWQNKKILKFVHIKNNVTNVTKPYSDVFGTQPHFI